MSVTATYPDASLCICCPPGCMAPDETLWTECSLLLRDPERWFQEQEFQARQHRGRWWDGYFWAAICVWVCVPVPPCTSLSLKSLPAGRWLVGRDCPSPTELLMAVSITEPSSSFCWKNPNWVIYLGALHCYLVANHYLPIIRVYVCMFSTISPGL